MKLSVRFEADRKSGLNFRLVFVLHGRKPKGPVTEDGKKRSAIAKTLHGYETRALLEYRDRKFRETQALFESMHLG